MSIKTFLSLAKTTLRFIVKTRTFSVIKAMIPALEWWAYVIVALSIFVCCLFVNYIIIIKLINDARSSEHLKRASDEDEANKTLNILSENAFDKQDNPNPISLA
ncbi:uncharacterized protein LOC101742332 [Bombyx mori]|uniref:Uncharacterized protein n=1 Tax=Bombyx mori TaxID=7091 RepID=A0A8R1WHZ2_BOMMO|nr:uncharacterized protein LOC101742332 [Bombyx mori]